MTEHLELFLLNNKLFGERLASLSLFLKQCYKGLQLLILSLDPFLPLPSLLIPCCSQICLPLHPHHTFAHTHEVRLMSRKNNLHILLLLGDHKRDGFHMGCVCLS
jgi:hypothetical protein